MDDIEKNIANIKTLEASKALIEEILNFDRYVWTDNMQWTRGQAYTSKYSDEVSARYLLWLSVLPWVVDKQGKKHKTEDFSEAELIEVLGLQETEALHKLIQLLVLRKGWEDNSNASEQREVSSFRKLQQKAAQWGVSVDELMERFEEEFAKKAEEEKNNDKLPVEEDIEIDLDSLTKDVQLSDTLTMETAAPGKDVRDDYGDGEQKESVDYDTVRGSGSHEGYDIGIFKDGETDERIEAKYQNGHELIVTQAEWECMKQSGDKYSIYWLSDKPQGGLNLRILKNPYQMVIEERISIIPAKFLI